MCKKIETRLEVLFGLMEEKLSAGGEVCFSPNGTSMLPLITPKCDRVTLKDCGGELKKHDIAFYKRSNGQFVLHRVIKCEKDGSYVMCGDNQWVLEKGVKKEQIIAVVSHLEKPKAEVKFSSAKYRAYCKRLWFRRLKLKTVQKGIVFRGFRKLKRILNKRPKR